MKLSTFTVREVSNRPGRAILTLLSIVIGVAAVVSVSMATSTTRQAFRDMYQTVAGKSSLVVTSSGGVWFDEAILKKIDDVPGVKSAVPSLQFDGKVLVTGRKTDEVHDDQYQLHIMGIDPQRDGNVRSFETAEGSSLAEKPEGIVLDSDVARSMKVKLGDQLGIIASAAGRKEYQIVGTVRPKEGGAVTSGGVVFFSLPVAQKLYKGTGKINFVHIVTQEGADIAKLEKEISKLLPEDIKVDRAGLSSKQGEESIVSAEQGLSIATWMSFVLAVFIILNTFLMNIGERRRQLSILRAIGATKQQVISMLMWEGVLMGILGTIFGMLLGFVGAYFLTRKMEDLIQAHLPPLVITPWPFILAPVFGIGVSLLGTFVPARKAGKLSPLEGMGSVSKEDREGDVPFFLSLKDMFAVLTFGLLWKRNPDRPLRIWPFFGLFLSIIGAVGLYICINGYLSVETSVPFAVILIFGMVLLMQLIIKPICTISSFLMRPIWGVESMLAARQLLRRRTRTSLTVGVLFVALTMGTGLGRSIMDNIADVRNWYKNTLVGELYVRSTMPSAAGDAVQIPEDFGDVLKAIPGTRRVAAVRFKKVDIVPPENASKQVRAQTFASLVTREFDPAGKANLNLVNNADPDEVLKKIVSGEVVIGSVLAQRSGLKAGENIVLETTQGPHPFRIAAISNEYAASGLVIFMRESQALNYFQFNGVTAYVIDAEPGKLQDVIKAVQVKCDEQGLIVQTLGEIVHKIDGMMDGVVGGQWLILVLGFCVAAFGIVNTLTMNVLEQTRELGLLRIVAMTRRQVRKIILSQASMIALLGLAPGIGAGLIMAYLMNLSMLPVIGHPVAMQWSWAMVLGSFGIGFVIVLLSAMLPAERAARIDISTALQYE